MPCVILGPVHIDAMDGNIVSGGVLNLSPNSTSKTVSGAGSFLTGDFGVVNTFNSITGVFDPDFADSNVTGNA